jgi:transcriptional regulator with XRE-family HTH domain
MLDIDEFMGRRLRSRRRVLGLTQQELATACGVRFQQIQKYECGANRMSAGRLWGISKVLGVPVSYFFDGFDDQRTMSWSEAEERRLAGRETVAY